MVVPAHGRGSWPKVAGGYRWSAEAPKNTLHIAALETAHGHFGASSGVLRWLLVVAVDGRKSGQAALIFRQKIGTL